MAYTVETYNILLCNDVKQPCGGHKSTTILLCNDGNQSIIEDNICSVCCVLHGYVLLLQFE
jgi:hypothetical protein